MGALLVFFFLYGFTIVHAELSSNGVVDLNGDCVQDTIMGEQLAGGKFMLREVRWGSRNSISHCDSSYYQDTVLVFRSRTVLRFPVRDLMSTGICILRYNQDDAHDLLVQASWTTDTSATGRSRKRRADSSLTFVIPAQRGIDTLDTLVVAEFNGTKHDPIVMRRIKQNNGADSVATSGNLYTVRQIKRKNIQVDLDNSVAGQLVLDVATKHETGEQPFPHLVVNVYPNPLSGDVVNVSVSNLRGNGELELYDGMGQLVANETIQEAYGTQSDLPLRVAHLPSGTYRLLITEHIGRIALAYLVINK